VEASAADPAGPPAAPRARRLGAFASIAVFMAPTLLVYVGLTAYPVLRTLVNSLHTIKPRGAEEFVGLANYAALLWDGTFWTAVGNTLIWAGVAPVLDVGVGLLLALCLYARVPFARFFRVAWFTPALISYVVVAIVWTWIYNYDWGAANALLAGIGLERLRTAWIGSPATALWALILVDVWKWAGFNMIVCLAALHSLPSEVVEAAELDRCGWMAKLVFIAVPMIRTTLTGLLILGFIGKMKVFDLVWIMTRGGPLWATETVSTYVYKRAFDWNTFDLGYPSALASVWFAVVLAGVMALSRIFRPGDRLEY
jgi:multiple sugar transport system permease protein/raffinose/stachyose/melibiose transport system permease protein